MPPSRLHPHDTDRDSDREEKKGKGPALRISLVIFKWALSGIMQKLPQSDQNHAHNNKHYVMGKRKGKWQRNGKGEREIPLEVRLQLTWPLDSTEPHGKRDGDAGQGTGEASFSWGRQINLI